MTCFGRATVKQAAILDLVTVKGQLFWSNIQIQCLPIFLRNVNVDISISNRLYSLVSRENEVREHIPVPYDNLFRSILSSRHAVKVIFSLGPMVAQAMANGHIRRGYPNSGKYYTASRS